MNDLVQWLLARDNFYVFGHVSPDGDCIGSVLATVQALKAVGKRACAILPGTVPEYLKFLPFQEDILSPESAPFPMQAALSVDVAAPGMLGENRALFESCAARAVIDHHESNPGFGQVNVLDPISSSAGELVLKLVHALGVPLTAGMAECIFTAVSADTGNFNYASTTEETFRTAAECVRAGADVDKITRFVYRTRTFARTKLLGAALSRAELLYDGRVALTCVTQPMFKSCGALREDTERIINYLIEIDGVQIAALATELDGEVKFSLRSMAPYNVARDVAQPLGGGGHERAAGVSIHKPLSEACALVLKRIGEIL